MEFEESKKIEAEVSETEFVENRVERKKKFSLRDKGIDLLDVAIVPTAIGVFVSLGFLFAGLFGAEGMGNISSIFTNIG